ncbi:nucleolar protein 58-like [Centruroides vittatus]|uniref:nucleolar protein 58-like n=1 Tax=Centruroides vittatus TaxID=120091 RepID=UPI0035105DF1
MRLLLLIFLPGLGGAAPHPLDGISNHFSLVPQETRSWKSCSRTRTCLWKSGEPESPRLLDYLRKRRWKLSGKGENKEYYARPKYGKNSKSREEFFPGIVYLKNRRFWKLKEENGRERNFYRKEESSEKEKDEESWQEKREIRGKEERKFRKSGRREPEGSRESEEERSSEEEEGKRERGRKRRRRPEAESGEKHGSSEEEKEKRERKRGGRRGWHWHRDRRGVGWLWHPPLPRDIWQESEHYRD